MTVRVHEHAFADTTPVSPFLVARGLRPSHDASVTVALRHVSTGGDRPVP